MGGRKQSCIGLEDEKDQVVLLFFLLVLGYFMKRRAVVLRNKSKMTKKERGQR